MYIRHTLFRRNQQKGEHSFSQLINNKDINIKYQRTLDYITLIYLFSMYLEIVITLECNIRVYKTEYVIRIYMKFSIFKWRKVYCSLRWNIWDIFRYLLIIVIFNRFQKRGLLSLIFVFLRDYLDLDAVFSMLFFRLLQKVLGIFPGSKKIEGGSPFFKLLVFYIYVYLFPVNQHLPIMRIMVTKIQRKKNIWIVFFFKI